MECEIPERVLRWERLWGHKDMGLRLSLAFQQLWDPAAVLFISLISNDTDSPYKLGILLRELPFLIYTLLLLFFACDCDETTRNCGKTEERQPCKLGFMAPSHASHHEAIRKAPEPSPGSSRCSQNSDLVYVIISTAEQSDCILYLVGGTSDRQGQQGEPGADDVAGGYMGSSY